MSSEAILSGEEPLKPGQQRVALSDVIAQISRLEQQNRLDDAGILADRVLAAVPEHPHVLHLSGIILYRQGKIAEAIARMEKSIALAPDVALYPRNMCEIYRGAGRLDDAVTSGRRAVELAPEDSRAYFNLALIHYERLELEESVRICDKALALEPDFAEAHFERAEALLLGGKMKDGWEAYEWRFKLKQAEGMLPKTDKPQWEGQKLAPGKLLLVADQGFGDCVQFGRFIPWAAQIAPAPVLACSGELTSILRQIPGIGRIVTRWELTGEFDA
ncbi:MAG: glycosyltransferase, partial [Acidocella sp. 21-58-7]